MKNKRIRQLSRILHVIAGLSFPLLIYSPLGDSEIFLRFNQVFLLPVVVFSGIVMWQQPKLSKWLKRFKTRGTSL